MDLKIYKVSQLRSLKRPLTTAILVDYSWVLHRCYHAYDLSVILNKKQYPEPRQFGTFKDLGDTILVNTGDIFGALRTLSSLTNAIPNSAIILCIDAKVTDKGLENENYKAGREPHPEVYAKMEEILASASLLPNVFISCHPGKEADEVIFTLSQKLSAFIPKVVLYANDKDLYQCFTKDNITMSNKLSGRKLIEYGASYAMEKFNGISPNKIPFFRSICASDVSDNLIAYPRFPRDVAVEIVTKFNSPEDFLAGQYSARTEARQEWVKLLRREPQKMLSLYKMHKIEQIENIGIYKAESTWRYIDMYSCHYTRSTFEKYIKLADM